MKKVKEEVIEEILAEANEVVEPKMYQINFDNVKTLEDVKILLKSFEIRVWADHKSFDQIKYLLKEM